MHWFTAAAAAQLSSLNIDDFADLQTRVSQQGSNVLLSFSSSQQILIQNMQLSSLSVDDFVFS